MKKIIILIATIFVVIILFAIIPTKNRNLSKNDFISLLKSFEQVSNVKLENDNIIHYIKDEYVLSVRIDGVHTWGNSETNEYIGYDPVSKIYSFLDYTDEESIGLEEFEYTFLGYEKYANAKCAVAEFKDVESNLTVKVWADSKKGTLVKTINSGIDSEGEKYEIINEYTATYGIVTDEDVRRPDLTEYTFYNEEY